MTTPLLIAEELFLLTHDDESGKARGLTPNEAVAGALLLDLAEAGVMKVDDRKRVLVTGEPCGHPLLDEAQAVIGADDKPRSVSHWVGRLPYKLKKIDQRVGRSLVDRGILGREERKTLGLFTTVRWPESDPAPERALRAGLADVLARGVTPTEHQGLLVPLLTTQDLIPKLVEKDDRGAARKRAKQITKDAKEGRIVSAAVSQAVQATQAAVMAAVVASTTVVTTSN
ncbi:GOLPH3/VPS74 family protein [Jatrophihabitans fulvus]